jgi:transcriptional regulator of arginine metabolism
MRGAKERKRRRHAPRRAKGEPLMADTAARRRALRRLISAGAVHSQAELVAALQEQGFAVTQATVSRDLAAMGVSKNGLRYVLGGRKVDHGHLARTISTYVETISVSGNLVVLRTPPGAAQVVAAALDAVELEGVIGTVAGDDTVLVVAAALDGGIELQARLEEMGETR